MFESTSESAIDEGVGGSTLTSGSDVMRRERSAASTFAAAPTARSAGVLAKLSVRCAKILPGALAFLEEEALADIARSISHASKLNLKLYFAISRVSMEQLILQRDLQGEQSRGQEVK